jgi:hypothetical protein
VEEQPDLITDRPDQTESAEVVPLFRLQIETGILQEWQESGSDFYIHNREFGGTLLRFGFHRRFEARLGTGMLQTRAKLVGLEPDQIHGIAPLEIGLKVKILKEDGMIPDVALIAGYQIPGTGGQEYDPEELIQTYLFAFAHTLGENLGLGYNLGLEHDKFSQQITMIYSLVFGFTAGDRVGIFIETYGNKRWYTGDQPLSYLLDVRTDAGITYLIRPNLQLDFSGGLGLSANSPDGFISAGITWRIPR